jgi:hypothetical protein
MADDRQQNLDCPICGERFRSQKQLEFHNRDTHALHAREDIITQPESPASPRSIGDRKITES